MTATQTKDHTDLTYLGRRGDVVTFGAPSQHNPAVTNLVSYDTRTGETLCTCKFCDTHPQATGGCWLTRNVVAAYYAHEYRLASTARLRDLDQQYAARQPFLDSEQLLRWGMVGDELGRRLVGAGTSAGRQVTRARGAAAKADLFGDDNVFEALTAEAR